MKRIGEYQKSKMQQSFADLDFLRSNARMLIDEHEQVSAAVDIFLDIAMFNSISFLKKLIFYSYVNIMTSI